MYPQYSPKKSSTTPQFNPTVQLSPRRVINASEDQLPVTFSPRTTVSPPRVIEYDNFEPEIAVSPPRVVGPPVTISPRRVMRMPEQVTSLPPPVRDIARFDQREDTTLTDLPNDVLIELLINLPSGKLNSLCRTTPALSRLCDDEQFLKDLITRKYRISINLIPGGTIREKYVFISRFNSRYFTDPDFVKISRSYEKDFGLDYTSRKTPVDALNTIISIFIDSQTVDDINVLKNFDVIRTKIGTVARPGEFSPRLVSLLSGAVMTKSQSFAEQIISILGTRIAVQDRGDYVVSFRPPFILSMAYGMDNTAALLAQYYDYQSDPQLRSEIIGEILGLDSIEILDRLIPFIGLNIDLYWRLVSGKKYDLADHVLIQLRETGTDPYSGEQLKKNTFIGLRLAISNGNIDKVKYMMKYMRPTQYEIDLAIRKGFNNIARVLQGLPEIEEEIEDEMDIVDE